MTALRKAHPGQYQNIHVIRTNAMKYLPNYFHKGQVSYIFVMISEAQAEQGLPGVETLAIV